MDHKRCIVGVAMELTAEETRVLGCLIEKQMTTPDIYPMTLNALLTACNQSSNREPVVNYDNRQITDALNGLRTHQQYVRIVFSGAGSRVDKFKHVLDERLAITSKEAAVLAVMLLRGPQTLNELKIRTERYVNFASLDEIDTVIDRLCDPTKDVDIAELPIRSDAGMLRSATNETSVEDDRPANYVRPWPGPLAIRLPRLPGQKEPRIGQLLSGPIDIEALAARAANPGIYSESDRGGAGALKDRVIALESETAQLREELANLRNELEAFRSQF